jgi:hypothetical protein
MALRVGYSLVISLLDAGLKVGNFLAKTVHFGAQAVALDGFASDLSDCLGRSARLSFARCDGRLPLTAGAEHSGTRSGAKYPAPVEVFKLSCGSAARSSCRNAAPVRAWIAPPVPIGRIHAEYTIVAILTRSGP